MPPGRILGIVYTVVIKEQEMNWHDQIVIDPAILAGKPVIKSTRIAVEMVVELVAEGWSRDQIIENYPSLTDEGVQAALFYAAEVLKRERVYPLTV